VTHRNFDAYVNSRWARQWRNMLTDHPVDYLVWRGRLFLAQLGITHGVRYPYFEGSVDLANGLGPSLAHAFPRALDVRNDVISTFNGPLATGSFLVVPAWYLLITGFALASLARDGSRRAAIAVFSVVLAMQGLLFFTAPGSEYRLEYFQVVLGTTFGMTAVARRLQSDAASRRGVRRRGPYPRRQPRFDTLTRSGASNVERRRPR
jgi:hypothetical protein